MTPPDKPGRTGQGAETDQTSAIATSGQAQQVDQAGGNHEGRNDGNGAAPTGSDGNGAAGTRLIARVPLPSC